MEKIIHKKSLGQNFLSDDAIADRIIESANISGEDVVIEIGPGEGVLTEKLAGKCKKVIAIELDDRLIPVLQNKFKDAGNVEIIHDDILKINLPQLIENHIFLKASEAKSYKLVANIPYYITAPIIRLLLETKYSPKEMIVMVQKEVAERIVAKPGEMSILAASVQYYADAQYLFDVPRTAFNPAPKVDSAVIKIIPYTLLPLGEGARRADEGKVTGEGKDQTKNFFRIVRAGFSAKRKTLANNLSSSLHLDKKEVEEKLESLGFSKNTRAQELGVEDWKKIANSL